jgi:hypothetical protein
MISAKDKLQKVVDSLLSGSLVPFIGAGISYCTDEDIDGEQCEIHLANPMATAICGAISRFTKDGLATPSIREFCTGCSRSGVATETSVYSGDKPATSTTLSFGSAKHTFPQCCEMLSELAGRMGYDEGRVSQELCETLRIDKFTHVAPARAHRYIAFLACEGLVHEVITTNYDCCLEHAFEDALGPSARSNPAQVAADLASYRECAGRDLVLIDPKSGARRIALKVYKINGCARRYAEACESEVSNHRESVAKSILLTERQLQDWRTRAWARDLFRDRLRARNLLFCGFTADEPQIRHTASLVTEEFSLIDGSLIGYFAKGDGSVDTPLNESNYLMFVGYKGKTPSFSQWQVMSAFTSACARNGQSRTTEGTEGFDRDLSSDLFFGPRDAADGFAFAACEDENCLEADGYFEELHSRVTRHLLSLALMGNSSEIARELTPMIRGAPGIITRVQVSIEDSNQSSPLGALFGWDEGTASTMLSRCLGALRGGQDSRGQYHSIADNGSLAAKMVLVLECLRSKQCIIIDNAIGAPGEPVKIEETDKAEVGDALLVQVGETLVVRNQSIGLDVIELLANWRNASSRWTSRLRQQDEDEGFSGRENGTASPNTCESGVERGFGAVRCVIVLEPRGGRPMNRTFRANSGQRCTQISLAELLSLHGSQIESLECLRNLLLMVARNPTNFIRRVECASRLMKRV